MVLLLWGRLASRQALQRSTAFGWQPRLVGSACCAWSCWQSLATGLRPLPSGTRPPNPHSWCGVTAWTAVWCHTPPPDQQILCASTGAALGEMPILPGMHIEPAWGWARLGIKTKPLYSGMFLSCNLAAACWGGNHLVTITKRPVKQQQQQQ